MARLTKIQKAYERYCKKRYYFILIVYTFYHIVQMGLINKTFSNVLWMCLAMLAITLYHCVKWYQLKHMKFRKNGFYKKRKRRTR